MVGGKRRDRAMRRDRESVLGEEVSEDTRRNRTVGRLKLAVVAEDGSMVVFFHRGVTVDDVNTAQRG